MKYNLKIVGSFFGSDGYSSHTRSLFNSLAKREDTNMKIEAQLPVDWMKFVNDNELDGITKEDNGKFDNIIVTLPHTWKLFTGLNKNYAYCVWEGDRVPESWIEEFMNDKIDFIFVPSMHTKNAIINTAKGLAQAFIYNKIKVIPHEVNRNEVQSHEVDVIRSPTKKTK